MMRTRKVTLGAAAFAAAAIASSPLCAQEDPGPGHVVQGEGGLITALVLDPSSAGTIYATTARGLYKTTDGGHTWTARGDGLGKHSVLALAVDPASHGSLFAATDTGGVYRSGDGGGAWSAANSGLATRWIGAVAFDPKTPGLVYAGTEAGRLFRSTDGGREWSELKTPFPQVSVSTITIDPVDSNLIYVGTNSEGVFRTSDGGLTWVRPTDRLKRGTIWNITVSPGSPSVVYAGTHDGLFKSSDRGLTWTGVSKGMKSYNVLAVALDPAHPETIYAATAIGVHKSNDGGATWSLLQSDIYVSALAIDPRNPNLLYAGTHLGVMKSVDGGSKWSSLDFAKRKDETLTAVDGAAAPLPTLPVRRGSPQVPGLKPLPVHPPSPPEVASAPRVTSAPDADGTAAPASAMSASLLRRESPQATDRNTLPVPSRRLDVPDEVAGARPAVARSLDAGTKQSPIELSSHPSGAIPAVEGAIATASLRPNVALRHAWAQVTGLNARPLQPSRRLPVKQVAGGARPAPRARAAVNGGH